MNINGELKERLRKLAELDHRSLSNLVEKVLADYADRKEGELRSPRSTSPP
jgi:predicted transcriptional regulator